MHGYEETGSPHATAHIPSARWRWEGRPWVMASSWNWRSGNGRVAIPVAQAHRQPIIGVDASPAMSAEARSRTPARPVLSLDLREERMRTFTAGNWLGAGVLPGPGAAAPAHVGLTVAPSSSGLPPTYCAQAGRFAWNAFAFDHLFAAAHDGRKAGDARIPHVIRYAVADNRVDLARADGVTSSLWWATKNEWLGPGRCRGPGRSRRCTAGSAGELLHRRQPRVRVCNQKAPSLSDPRCVIDIQA